MAQGPVSCGSYELGRGPWGHAWKGPKADSRRRFRTSQHSSAGRNHLEVPAVATFVKYRLIGRFQVTPSLISDVSFTSETLRFLIYESGIWREPPLQVAMGIK